MMILQAIFRIHDLWPDHLDDARASIYEAPRQPTTLLDHVATLCISHWHQLLAQVEDSPGTIW